MFFVFATKNKTSSKSPKKKNYRKKYFICTKHEKKKEKLLIFKLFFFESAKENCFVYLFGICKIFRLKKIFYSTVLFFWYLKDKKFQEKIKQNSKQTISFRQKIRKNFCFFWIFTKDDETKIAKLEKTIKKKKKKKNNFRRKLLFRKKNVVCGLNFCFHRSQKIIFLDFSFS